MRLILQTLIVLTPALFMFAVLMLSGRVVSSIELAAIASLIWDPTFLHENNTSMVDSCQDSRE